MDNICAFFERHQDEWCGTNRTSIPPLIANDLHPVSGSLGNVQQA